MLILADFAQIIGDFINETGIAQFFQAGGWKNLIMIAVACLLLYLAVAKKFEPYLLIPIATGMLLVNLPGSGVFVNSTKELYTLQEFASLAGISVEQATTIFNHLGLDLSGTYQLGQLVVADQAYVDMLNTLSLSEVQIQNIIDLSEAHYSGLLGYLYYGVKWGIYPCLIFLGIGASTDFGPLIANPKSMLLGAAAQIGIFTTFLLAIAVGFTGPEAASIGIIGGADGPTAILTTSTLAPDLLPAISVAAYSYMALVPVIQPPIIRGLTTKEERKIKMTQLREVSKKEKILFRYR